MDDLKRLLQLLQLASPTLPVGAYSYSEGIETSVATGIISDRQTLEHWLLQELQQGGVRIEAAVMVRAYTADPEILRHWNAWLSATRETESLRLQSWQMGGSLLRLLVDLEPAVAEIARAVGSPCNYAIAFGIAAYYWQLPLSVTVASYLHTWASDRIAAGVKLIPLGQTAGQQLLLSLHEPIAAIAAQILRLGDHELASWTWGLAFASLGRQQLHTRLFRS